MSYMDWQGPFEAYFGERMRDLAIVELGKGEGTRWLHRHFRRVASLEYSRYPFTASWEAEGLPNHTLVNLETPANLLELDNVLVHSRGSERPEALREEARKIHETALGYEGEVLFIDHGCHNRGEVLALALRSHWRYVIIHDTNFPYYGYQLASPWHRVTSYPIGQGTMVFTRKDPVVTVVIPSVGRPTISRTLRSLLRQTNPLWRALVGFDGLSPQDVSSLDLPKDPRITYRFLPKVGGGHNYGGQVRNLLMTQAETEWVSFLDDDDTFREDYVDRLLTEQALQPDASVVVFRMSYDAQDTKVLPPLHTTRAVMNSVGISFALKTHLLQNPGLRFQNGSTEDFYFLKTLEALGEKTVFSEHITYNIRF